METDLVAVILFQRTEFATCDNRGIVRCPFLILHLAVDTAYEIGAGVGGSEPLFFLIRAVRLSAVLEGFLMQCKFLRVIDQFPLLGFG